MKASELRIGNFVYQEQTIDDLEIVEAGLGTLVNALCLKPIPLTEEWLVKFGFDWKEKSDEVRWYNYSSNYPFEIYEMKGKFYPDSCEENGAEIEFVHQLQNSYFEWTREELTIKEKG
jgi:hypothetical protein